MPETPAHTKLDHNAAAENQSPAITGEWQFCLACADRWLRSAQRTNDRNKSSPKSHFQCWKPTGVGSLLPSYPDARVGLSEDAGFLQPGFDALEGEEEQRLAAEAEVAARNSGAGRVVVLGIDIQVVEPLAGTHDPRPRHLDGPPAPVRQRPADRVRRPDRQAGRVDEDNVRLQRPTVREPFDVALDGPLGGVGGVWCRDRDACNGESRSDSGSRPDDAWMETVSGHDLPPVSLIAHPVLAHAEDHVRCGAFQLLRDSRDKCNIDVEA